MPTLNNTGRSGVFACQECVFVKEKAEKSYSLAHFITTSFPIHKRKQNKIKKS